MSDFTESFAKSKALIDNARSSMGVVVNAVTVDTSYLLGKYMIEEEQQGYEIDVKLCAFTASEMKEAQKEYNSFEGISDKI